MSSSTLSDVYYTFGMKHDFTQADIDECVRQGAPRERLIPVKAGTLGCVNKTKSTVNGKLMLLVPVTFYQYGRNGWQPTTTAPGRYLIPPRIVVLGVDMSKAKIIDPNAPTRLRLAPGTSGMNMLNPTGQSPLAMLCVELLSTIVDKRSFGGRSNYEMMLEYGVPDEVLAPVATNVWTVVDPIIAGMKQFGSLPLFERGIPAFADIWNFKPDSMTTAEFLGRLPSKVREDLKLSQGFYCILYWNKARERETRLYGTDSGLLES